MQRYFVWLSYDGTGYHGWQIQPNGNSVQAELQRGLSLLLREEVLVVGAGRTDTGVHARMMAAHFDTCKEVDCSNMEYKLNRILPRDISVCRVEPVAPGMHARFSARARTYHYYIHTRKDPFCRAYSYEVHCKLDFAAMNRAAEVLMEYDDFAAFCKSNSDNKTTLCHVSQARWIKDSDYSWHFVITANRFLRNMVRAVVGTLIDVGRHRVDLEGLRKIIEGKSRCGAGESMPGNALFLERVEY